MGIFFSTLLSRLSVTLPNKRKCLPHIFHPFPYFSVLIYSFWNWHTLIHNPQDIGSILWFNGYKFFYQVNWSVNFTTCFVMYSHTYIYKIWFNPLLGGLLTRILFQAIFIYLFTKKIYCAYIYLFLYIIPYYALKISLTETSTFLWVVVHLVTPTLDRWFRRLTGAKPNESLRPTSTADHKLAAQNFVKRVTWMAFFLG